MSNVCPLTKHSFRQPCEVSSCMWWSENRINGCFAGSSPEEDELVKLKGLKNAKSLELKIQEGSAEIERMILLDAYYNFVRERGETPVKCKIHLTYPLTFEGHNWTSGLVATACRKDVFEAFIREHDLEDIALEGILGIETPVILNIRGYSK